jgi:hypothetical protein
MNYVESHHQEIKDVRGKKKQSNYALAVNNRKLDAGHYLLRAFDKASREIVVGVDFIWDAGTTTLLGGLALELDNDRWCFVCANVGDCKVANTFQFYIITK